MLLNLEKSGEQDQEYSQELSVITDPGDPTSSPSACCAQASDPEPSWPSCWVTLCKNSEDEFIAQLSVSSSFWKLAPRLHRQTFRPIFTSQLSKKCGL